MLVLERIRTYLSFVRFEHTVFALPFVLTSAWVCSGGMPPLRQLFWIIVAAVGARSAAMGFNRIADLHFDRLNPADIPKLLAKLSEGFDVVSGWRKERKDPFTKTLPSKIANALIAWATGVRVHDLGCSLRAYRAWVLQTLAQEGLHHRYMPIYCAAKGARIAEVVVHHRPRTVGKSKYGLRRFFAVLHDLPLLIFLARYSQNPFSGLMTMGVVAATITFLGSLMAFWLRQMWLLPLMATFALAGSFWRVGHRRRARAAIKRQAG